MKWFIKSFPLIGFVFSLPGMLMAADFMGTGSNGPLTKAHSAYLARNFESMAIEMKNALQASPNDPQVKENVFALLKKAYEMRGTDGISTDWHLPEEVTHMKVSVRLTQREIPEYALTMRGNIVQGQTIKQLRVTRYPDQVILDKQSGIGEFEEEPASNGDDPEFGFQSKKSRQPIPAGLYLLRLELTNGKNVDGWFLLEDDLSSTATPRVMIPALGETFKTGNPTFRWEDFRSPEYKSYERRSVWMSVSRSEPPNYAWDLKWERFEDSPTSREAAVVNKLDNGRYIFVIKYNETHRFGDMIIGRDSTTSRPFRVQQ